MHATFADILPAFLVLVGLVALRYLLDGPSARRPIQSRFDKRVSGRAGSPANRSNASR